MLWVDEGKGTGWTFRTPANSMIAYNIESYLGKTVTVTIGTHYGCATLNGISKGKNK